VFRRLDRNLSGLALVRTTLPSRQQAEALAQRLVEERVAACAHVTEVASVYRWDGRQMQETEFVVEARTRWTRREALADAMLRGHPYEVPLVECWPVLLVPRSYREWVEQNVD
jgi:periplasmic divalent cation tolerance protein